MISADLASLAVPVGSLHLLPGNPRRGDVEAIAASLKRFGQRKPVVARRSDNVVIAGNHTLLAARFLGWGEVAAVWVDDDEATAKAYSLADNRTAELGGYDERELAELIAQVQAAEGELLAATGWTDEDLATLVALLNPVESGTSGPDQDVLDATDRAGWPVIRALVPPEVYQRWQLIEGEDDAARVVALLEVAGH